MLKIILKLTSEEVIQKCQQIITEDLLLKDNSQFNPTPEEIEILKTARNIRDKYFHRNTETVNNQIFE